MALKDQLVIGYQYDPQEILPQPVVPQLGNSGSWSSASFIQASNAPTVHYTYTAEDGGAFYGSPDEDFWVNPVAPVAAAMQRIVFFPDPEELPATTLRGQPDEDYWQNAVPPTLRVLWQRLPYLQTAEEFVPQPVTTLSPDEDFWVSGLLPLQATLYQQLPYLPDPEELPAGALLTQLGLGSGDASWASQTFIMGNSNPTVGYSFDPQDPGGSTLVQTFFPEEDFWTNQVAPVIPEPTILWAGDDIALNNNFDEDFWISGVAPILTAPNNFPQPAIFETGEWVPPPIFVQGALDEDFWVNAVAPLNWPGFVPQQASFDPSEPAFFFGQADEDFWQNPVSPVAASFWQSLPVVWDDQLIFTPIVPGDDSELWQNPTAPVYATMFIRFPYGAGTDDDLVVLQPVIAPSGQNSYLIYGLQGINRHLTHI